MFNLDLGIDSGDMLVTDNGNFMLVRIETDKIDGWGAMFVDKGYSLEMQYVNEKLDDLIKEMEKDCRLINHVKYFQMTLETDEALYEDLVGD